MKLFTLKQRSISRDKIEVCEGILCMHNGLYFFVIVGNKNECDESVQVHIPVHNSAVSKDAYVYADPQEGHRLRHVDILKRASLVRLAKEDTLMFIPEIEDAKETARAGILVDIALGKNGNMLVTSAEIGDSPCKYNGQGMIRHSVYTSWDGTHQCSCCHAPVTSNGDSIFTHPDDVYTKIYKGVYETSNKVHIAIDGVKMEKRILGEDPVFHRTMFLILEPGASLRFLVNSEYYNSYETAEFFLYWDGKILLESCGPRFDIKCVDAPLEKLEYDII